MKTTTMTLVYPVKDTQTLLGLKKLRIGQGTYVGFGGRVEPNESIEETAIRELQEECGLTTSTGNLINRGCLKIHNPRYAALGVLKIHIFTLTSWKGTTHETDEMKPEWFERKRMPWEKMRESEAYWLPAVLNGRKVEVEIWYDIAENLKKMRVGII